MISGGVMLVHDIRKNETRVIDFRETAPLAIDEKMLLTDLQDNVRNYSGGLFIIPIWGCSESLVTLLIIYALFTLHWHFRMACW